MQSYPVMALLSVESVTVHFGGVTALSGASLSLEKGQIAGLIGPNGAGKTTLFNVITRIYSPESGTVAFDGENLLHFPPHAIVRRGIARTFQNLELFLAMTVLENVLVGAHSTMRFGRGERMARARALSILDYLGLADIANRRAAGLPFGTLKRVELARALISGPRLLLLDEPASGLNHEDVGALAELIRNLRHEFELTVLLVEHHMQLVMSVSERVHVLNFGRKLAEGTPQEVRDDPAVIASYLGSDIDAAA
jgi:branched-chain amino acid transport system ATP-binding protein